jgi:hypothetical protein
MNASKKIRQLIDKKESPDQVQVLKDLAVALQLRHSFDVGRLYQIDIRFFDIAMDLLKEWRFDHYIASRSKLIEQLIIDQPPPHRTPAPDEAKQSNGRSPLA